jgi:MFS family permease
VGLTNAALFLPVLFLALPGGRLADRFDRRRLLVAAQVLAMVATGGLAILAATGNVGVPAVLVVSAVVGIQYALSIPTMLALLPALVEPDELGMAIGLNSITYSAARILGPAIAAALITQVGYGAAFALNSLSFAALIFAVMKMRPRRQVVDESGSIREALRFAWNDKRIRLMLIGVTTVFIAMDPLLTLGPAFVTALGEPVSHAPWLMAAFGVGAIVAAAVATKGFRSHGSARYSALAPWTLVYAAGMAGLAFAPSIGVALLAVVAAGSGFLVTSTNWTAGLQEETPDPLRGRVMAIWTLCTLGSRPFASIFDGAMADATSPRLAATLLLVPLVIVGLLGARRLSRRRGSGAGARSGAGAGEGSDSG